MAFEKLYRNTLNNSSVEQAFSYFTVTGYWYSKKVLLFVLIIFYLRSAKCFFTAYAIAHGYTSGYLVVALLYT